MLSAQHALEVSCVLQEVLHEDSELICDSTVVDLVEQVTCLPSWLSCVFYSWENAVRL